jgi:hypothetical protein
MLDQSFSCNDIDDLMQSYADDELTSDVRTLFEEHVGSCSRCRAAVRVMGETISLIEQLQPVSPPPHFDDSILASLGFKHRRIPILTLLPSRATGWRLAWAALVLALISAPFWMASYALGGRVRGSALVLREVPKWLGGAVSALGAVPTGIVRWYHLLGFDNLSHYLIQGTHTVAKAMFLAVTSVSPLVPLVALIVALLSTLLLLRSLGTLTVHPRRIDNGTSIIG